MSEQASQTQPPEPTPEPPASTPALAAPWRIPAAPSARFLTELGRALRRQCPYCGQPGIFSGWWTLREQCPHCGVSFVREDGYFLGAYALNLVFAEFIGLGLALYLLFGTSLRELPLGWQMVIAAALAIALPIILFPYSRTVWMAIDLTANPPGENPERYLRGQQVLNKLPPRR